MTIERIDRGPLTATELAIKNKRLRWEERQVAPRRDCDTCKYADADIHDPQCVGCYDIGITPLGMFPKWTPINCVDKSSQMVKE